MALGGIAGLAGAPLAAGKLSRTAQACAGALLAAVLLAAATLLLLTTSAYGEGRTVPKYPTPTQLRRTKDNISRRALRNLRWALALAVGPTTAPTAAVTVSWTSQPLTNAVHVIDTRPDAADRHIALAQPGGEIELPAGHINSIQAAPTCENE